MKRTFPGNRGRSGRSRPESGATSDSTGRRWRVLPGDQHRHLVVPHRPGEQDPVAGTESPTAPDASVHRYADAGRGDEDPVPLPALHHFRVPADDGHPGLLRRVPHRRQRASRVSIGNPLFEDQAARIATAMAPQTARSFTVPQTPAGRCRRPEEGGVTTYPSVVKAISPSIRPRSPGRRTGTTRGCRSAGRSPSRSVRGCACRPLRGKRFCRASGLYEAPYL